MADKMTREEAYKILGLDPSEPMDKVKQKYENYMRRAKFDDSFDDVLITRAYDTLTGVDWGNFEPDPVYSEKGLNKKKVENFFYHYKRSLIYGAAVVVLLVSIIIMIATGTTRYNYKISVLGQVTISDQELMASYYEELLDVKNVLVDYFIVGGTDDGDADESHIYKLMGDLQGGESDLFIITEDYAKFLSYDGGLTDLTPYISDLGISPDDENLLIWYDEYGDEIVAGYRFGNKSIFNEGMNGLVPEYLVIPHHSEYSEETKTVILDLIEQNR